MGDTKKPWSYEDYLRWVESTRKLHTLQTDTRILRGEAGLPDHGGNCHHCKKLDEQRRRVIRERSILFGPEYRVDHLGEDDVQRYLRDILQKGMAVVGDLS